MPWPPRGSKHRPAPGASASPSTSPPATKTPTSPPTSCGGTSLPATQPRRDGRITQVQIPNSHEPSEAPHGQTVGTSARRGHRHRAAAPQPRPGGRADRRLERPAPQDRADRLAAPGRRRRDDRQHARHQKPQQLRPRPGRPGRTGAGQAGRGAAAHRDGAGPGAGQRPYGRQRPRAETGRAAGGRGAGRPAEDRHRRSVAVHRGRPRDDLAGRPFRPGHVHRGRQAGQRRPDGRRAERAVAAVQARHPGLLVGEAGQASVDRATNSTISADFRRAEVTSIPVTLVLLLVVFGALIAAGIPLLLAGTAVVTAISLLAIPSRWLPVGSTTSSIVLLVGMAVGIDYSLFYLRREREERAAGRGKDQALRIAAATSGRAIVVSGLTVMISLAGLFLTGIDVFSGLAVGTITVVGVSVLGSLTALPAALSLLGTWVDKGKIPFLGRRRITARRSRVWEGMARRVVARPVLAGGVAALALGALAVPALGMRLDSPGFHDLPASLPVVKNLLATQWAFPGGPAPAEVVVTGHDLTGPAVRHAVAAVAGRAATSAALREPVTSTLLGHGQVLVVSVGLAGGGTDTTSNQALTTLRDQVLPATLGRVGGISYAVTGLTAGNHDFSAQLDGRAPLVFLFVLGLAFLLLMMTFRSITIPAMSIALNLLSIGAAYGVLTLVFQHGYLHGPLGFSPYGGIVPWMPLFMFVILFGLSMDYHVFILSRIRELRSRGAPTKEAIIGGI